MSLRNLMLNSRNLNSMQLQRTSREQCSNHHLMFSNFIELIVICFLVSFLEDEIFCLTTPFEGVFPSFWKAPTLSSVSHETHSLSLAHRSHVLTLMFQGFSRYDVVRLGQKESSHYCLRTGSESVCLTERTVFSERKWFPLIFSY